MNFYDLLLAGEGILPNPFATIQQGTDIQNDANGVVNGAENVINGVENIVQDLSNIKNNLGAYTVFFLLVVTGIAMIAFAWGEDLVNAIGTVQQKIPPIIPE